MWVVLFFELIVLAGLCMLVLRQYISFKRTPTYAIVSTWLGWLICFAIVFLVPIDIADADHTRCLNQHNGDEHMCDEPISYLPPAVMKVQWSTLYWGTLVMSWLLFPILQTFFLASDFTTWERSMRAIRENIYLYIGMAIVGAIFLISLAIARSLTGAELMNLVMALANAYGLCLVVVLMGYGLVDIPRYLFRRADRDGTLKFYHAQLAKYKEDMDSAEEQLTATLQLVKSIADRVKEHDPYRYYVDIILTKCPPQYEDITSGGGDIGDLSYSKLVALHGRVREDRHNVERAVCLYEMCLRKAFKVEDIIRVKEVGSPDSKIHWSFIRARTYNHANIVDSLEYYWEIYLHTSAHRAAAILGAMLSIVIVWCEITLVGNYNNKHLDLSPFSQIIKKSHMQNFGKQLFCFIPLAYMTLCAYTTLFKIRLFNYYRLVPHQMSDPHSIMFSANYLCRLAAPLAFNFLKLIHQDDSAFTAVMGEMDAFPFLGKQFIFFFPIFVAVVCMMTLFNVWGKIGSMCCIRKLRYVPEDDYKLVSEGEALLKQERDKREGKGAPSTTVKQDIRSKVSKVFKHASKDANKVHTGEPDSPAGAHQEPSKPLTAVQAVASKYRGGRGHDDGADLPSTSRFARTDSSSSAPAPAPQRSRTGNLDDLLPANSRFSRNAAVLNNNIEPSDSLRDFSQTSSAPISTSQPNKPTFMAGLFGGKKNDEVGLLPRGSKRGDSLV